MKGIKVIDVGSNPKETQFGTCELCFSFGVADNPYMVLEFPDGTQVTVDTYEWDWGDCFEYHVANIVDFSAWLSEQELPEDDVEALKNDGKQVLIRLINEYKMEKLADWLHSNDNETNRQHEFALVTLVVNGANAVEIEKEKLYTVEIEGISSSKLFKNIQTNKYLFHSGNGLKGYTDRLTEQEIKQADERLWQFAKEAEEK